jgi:hypothetical protein
MTRETRLAKEPAASRTHRMGSVGVRIRMANSSPEAMTANEKEALNTATS